MAVFKVFFQHNKDEVSFVKTQIRFMLKVKQKSLFKRPQLQYRIHY